MDGVKWVGEKKRIEEEIDINESKINIIFFYSNAFKSLLKKKKLKEITIYFFYHAQYILCFR